MKTLNNTILLLILNFALCSITVAQVTQTLRGTIIDEDSKIPLIGANVILNGANPPVGATTNADGEFRFEKVPVGRVDLLVRYIGYEEKSIPNILVSSGKEVILNLEMKESLHQIDEVVVKAQKNKGDVLNEMAIISAHSFSVEETNRYAGSFQDPSRMVSAYAGVTSDPMGNNDIVVRGNSPKGILWRLEGIEIPNPNHFGNEGATGGAISALNSELLSNSDFYTGAFSPEYGDAMSGVFDMNMRSGNNEKREYSFGLGVLGTDITMEGPFSKNYGGSYLFNYRYSSLSLLNSAGIVDFDGIPKFQDAAFKIMLPTKKFGFISFFGLGGLSSIEESETAGENSNKVVEKGIFKAQLGVIGLNYTYPLSDNSFIKLTTAISNNGSSYKGESLDSLDNFVFDGKGDWGKNTFRSSLLFSSKLSSQHRVIVGIKYTDHAYNLNEYYYDDDENRWIRPVDMKKSGGILQSYISWKYRLNNNLTFVGGLHSMYFSLNKDLVIEPRAALRWQMSQKQSLNFGYGSHSKAESIYAYYTLINLPNGNTFAPNTNLGLSKANHYILGYEYRISKNLNTKIDFYYQGLYNIPVEDSLTSSFTILNSDEGYLNKALVNAGTGSNYGIEYTLEHFFANRFYFLLTASLYDSKYKAREGITRNTKYNGNYAMNFLIGKEFKVGKPSKAKYISMNGKFFYNGGRRYIPINLEESINKGYSVYDNSKAWVNKLDPIWQINYSISYLVNRPKTSHEFLIDINNITNNQGRIWEYYNEHTGKADYNRQLNLLPNILYRIHF
jgi:hypothetical protein